MCFLFSWMLFKCSTISLSNSEKNYISQTDMSDVTQYVPFFQVTYQNLVLGHAAHFYNITVLNLYCSLYIPHLNVFRPWILCKLYQILFLDFFDGRTDKFLDFTNVLNWGLRVKMLSVTKSWPFIATLKNFDLAPYSSSIYEKICLPTNIL